MARTVAVFGHSGFIGRELSRQLAAGGWDVRGASSRECDLRDLSAVRSLTERLPHGAQLVCCAVVNRLVDDSFTTFERNLRIAEHVAAALPGRITGVIYLSSVDVYGRSPALPVTERTAPAPSSYYGVAKLASEWLLRRKSSPACPVTVLRLPGVYGAGDRGQSVIGRLLAQLKRDGAVTVHGDGSSRRDYVEVGDVCAVIRAALERPADRLLNVATGISASIREIVGVLGEAAGVTPRIRHAPADGAAAGDLVFDPAALRRALPDVTFKSVREGAAAYAAAMPPVEVQA